MVTILQTLVDEQTEPVLESMTFLQTDQSNLYQAPAASRRRAWSPKNANFSPRAKMLVQKLQLTARCQSETSAVEPLLKLMSQLLKAPRKRTPKIRRREQKALQWTLHYLVLQSEKDGTRWSFTKNAQTKPKN